MVQRRLRCGGFREKILHFDDDGVEDESGGGASFPQRAQTGFSLSAFFFKTLTFDLIRVALMRDATNSRHPFPSSNLSVPVKNKKDSDNAILSIKICETI